MAEFKISRQEIISLCRLCLAKDLASIDIFETGSETRQLFTKIVACLPVQIMTDDSLPKKICEVCNSKVDDFYQFWTSTAKNQKQLNDWLQIATTDSIKTDTTQIKVEADDTRQGEEYDDYDDGGRGDDEDDDDEDAPSAPKRIKTQDSGDEDFKPTNLVESAMEDTSDINGQQGGSNRKSKERQFETGLMGVVTRDEWEILLRDKVRICPKCNKEFYSDRTMRRHLKQVHVEIKTFSCEECDKIFATREKLQRHWNYIHQGIRNTGPNQLLECHYCGITKNNKTLLRDHISAHLGIKPYCCIFCEEKYFSKKSLKRHEAKHNKVYNKAQYQDYQIQDLSMDQYRELVQSKERKCPKCEKEFSTPRYMRKHLREIHSAQKSHVCDQCGNQYKTKSSLGEHKKYMHSGKSRKKKYNKFQCNICGALHATKYTLRDHMNTHTGKKFKCDVCGNGYTSVKHLKRHKIKHMKESGELPPSMIHKCPTCYKIFTENHALKKHLDWVHGNKCHICKVCGAKIKGNLQQHMETHSGEKKICCHICGKKLRGRLNEHMLTHTGERPYACEFCGSSFKDKSYLRIHIRKHNGERPFTCSECGQSFAARSAFSLHLKKHAGFKQRIECEYCKETFPSKLKFKEHMKIHLC